MTSTATAVATQVPLVTVLVPARNEADDIARCLEAVAAQDFPLDRIEVVVVDGNSSDATIGTAEAALARHPFARSAVVDNPAGSTPSNLNVGLTHARGRYLCRVDARSVVPTDYVRRCTEVLERRPDVAVVGGSQVAVVGRGRSGVAIARALNNPLGMGLARYRSGRPSGEADTVYLGCFRTRDLHDVGGWNEAWATNQDFELNRRMARRGVIWFESGLSVGYVPRPTISSLAAQYHRFGRWKVRYWRRTGDRPRPRQVALMVGPVVGSVTGAAAVVSLARTPRRLVALAVAALAGMVAIESRSAGPDATLVVRAASIMASAAVAGGWLSGIGRELVRPDSPRSGTSDR